MAATLSSVVHSELEKCRFGFYNAEEIRRISVVRITSPISMDELGNPIRSGLYDPALGPLNDMGICETCSMIHKLCPGHPGHIELVYPLYHPLLFLLLYKLIRCVCFNCHHLKIKEEMIETYKNVLKSLRNGELMESVSFLDDMSTMPSKESDEAAEEGDAVDDTDLDNILSINRKRQQGRRPAKSSATDKAKTEDDSLLTHVIEQQNEIFLHFLRNSNIQKCSHCHTLNPSLRKDQDSRIFQQPLPKRHVVHNIGLGANVGPLRKEGSEDEAAEGSFETVETCSANKKRYIPPQEIKERLKKLYETMPELLIELFGSVQLPSPDRQFDPSMFFVDTLAVSPSRFRPPAMGFDGRQSEHPQNIYYSRILNLNAQLAQSQQIESADMSESRSLSTLMELQKALNFLIDSSRAPINAPNGIKQLLEKKEGLFRKHMMGKRVNFAARTVISPDVCLDTNQIGVPLVFAKKLTFAEPVTMINYQELSAMVENGPDVYPGANFVQTPDGKLTEIRGGPQNAAKRMALSRTLLTESSTSATPGSGHSNQTIVYRHLKNGDVVLMNRQPTLHKPSMMSHFVRVQMEDKVLRMHYANCKTFNADFDGDEMNMHFPQTYQAQAEAKHIMLSDHQYISGTNGGPLRGLIQDHVVSGVLLTKRDSFFTREQFQQLLFVACSDTCSKHPLETPIPCILKPRPLWSGKQVISSLLHHMTRVYGGEGQTLNLDSPTTVKEKMWGSLGLGEGQVIIRNNYMLCGVVDKSQIGAAAFGLVHSCYELFGPPMAGKMLSVLGKLFTFYLQQYGFTCGIDDLLLTSDTDTMRRKRLSEMEMVGTEVSRKFVNLDKSDQRADAIAGKNTRLSSALQKKFRESETEAAKLDSQMQSSLNQFSSEVVEECRSGFVKKFPRNFLSLMTASGAKGSEVNQNHISVVLGQQVLEGRRVPTMPSGKTLPSFAPYDPGARAGGYVSDRYLTGIRPQEFFFHCMAGREGLTDTTVKTSTSGYLQRCCVKHLEGLVVQYDYTVRDSDGSIVQFLYGEDCIDTMQTKFLDQFTFLARNHDTLSNSYEVDSLVEKNLFETSDELDEHYNNYCLYKRRQSGSKNSSGVLPVLSRFNPERYLGAVSEKFYDSLSSYIEKDEEGFFSHKSQADSVLQKRILNKELFKVLMFLKYHRCLVHPGEAVGVVAGESIGEPSTQMTLNTFHLAGHGETNVTLGIPRLKEILQSGTANIRTPLMTIPLQEQVTEEQAYKFANQLYRLRITELLSGVQVKEQVVETSAGTRNRCYAIRISFIAPKKLKKEHNLSVSEFEDVLLRRYMPNLLFKITKTMKLRQKEAVDSGMSSERFTPVDEETDGAANENVLEVEADTSSQVAAARVAAKKADDIVDRSMKKKNTEYDSDEVETGDSEEEEEEAEAEAEAEAEESEKEEESSTNNDEHEEKERDFLSSARAESSQSALINRLKAYPFLHSIQYDGNKNNIHLDIRVPADNKKLLLVSIIEEVSENFVISAIPGINHCYVRKKPTDKTFSVSTEGSNIRALWNYAHIINDESLYTNNIHEMMVTYGVEAARACIINEITSVFNPYGIKVDRRHLCLMADYMTFDGGYMALNRIGMNSKPSPLLKMSFETSVRFLCNAAQQGEVDPLKSPSSRIAMGIPVAGGTGFVDVVQPLNR